jgi:CHRD domain
VQARGGGRHGSQATALRRGGGRPRRADGGLVCDRRRARRPARAAAVEAFQGAAKWLSGDARRFVDGFRPASGEARGPTTLHYVFTYEGLEGGTSLFAHVHFGERAVAGGVSFFLCGGGGHPAACPDVSGTVEDDVTPADVVGPNGQGIEAGSFSEIVRAMRAGTAYANIHTTRWPLGEIRGQINDMDQKQFEG